MKKKNEKKRELLKKQENKKNLLHMETTIKGYGFEYSLKKFLLTMLCIDIGLIVTGQLLKLNMASIMVLLIVVFLCLPIIIINQYKYLYNQTQFTDVVNYMETMIMNFLQKPKILEGLLEVQKSYHNKMTPCVEEAITNCKEGLPYDEVLKPIEKEYGCNLLFTLHRFLTSVESNGGEYRSMLSALMDSVSGWEERTYMFQKERRRNKLTVYVSIIGCAALSCIGLWMAYQMKDVHIWTSTAYQIATTVMLCIFVFLITLLESKLNGSWLKRTEQKDISKLYDRVIYFDERFFTKKNIAQIVTFAILLFIAFMLKNQNLMLAIVIIAAFFLLQPRVMHKKLKKSLEKEMEKDFGDWLRPVALDLSRENVQVAIMNSYENAPDSLKPELTKLVFGMNNNPASIKPFDDFMKGFSLPNIKRAMKIIYSVGNISREETQKMITSLIVQNEHIAEKGENYEMEDQNLAVKNIMYLSPVICGLKMMVDMGLIFYAFISNTQGFLG